MDWIRRWAGTGAGVDYAWLAFAVANLAAMEWLIRSTAPSGIETVPFHFIYVSFTILYGFRTWKTRGVVAGIVFVTVSTGLMTLVAIDAGKEEWPELFEVPLMTLMFLAMVFHVRRRQEAVSRGDRLAAELRTALDRQQAFVSDASHELLTPITIARGHIDLLGRPGASQDEDVEHAAEIVVAELDRMQRVIDRLLLVESVSTEDGLELVPTSAVAFAEELFERWRPAADRRWSLETEGDGAVPMDRERMTAAMDALLENAVRHTAEGGAIEIAARVDGDHLRLEVGDDGPGVPPAVQERIFDRFYRVERGRSRRTGGAGLGLSIVKAVVEAHGGSVAVRSTPGEGARFLIDLPGLVSAGQQPVPATAHGLDPDQRLELAP
jgi:signal transduction histidine kinase